MERAAVETCREQLLHYMRGIRPLWQDNRRYYNYVERYNGGTWRGLRRVVGWLPRGHYRNTVLHMVDVAERTFRASRIYAMIRKNPGRLIGTGRPII